MHPGNHFEVAGRKQNGEGKGSSGIYQINLGIINELNKGKFETEDMVDLGVLNKRQRENSKTNESE